VNQLKQQYQKGGLGDGQTKKILEECLQEIIKPIRDRRQLYLDDKAELIRLLKEGNQKANVTANTTVKRVRASFGLNILGY
jgi:tryptophanyl-tRNA synthetase